MDRRSMYRAGAHPSIGSVRPETEKYKWIRARALHGHGSAAAAHDGVSLQRIDMRLLPVNGYVCVGAKPPSACGPAIEGDR